ncbi:hypothetical protein ACIBFB_06115 [Nocardiopsis sp. NPDC050513]|uniref:hypothetical protein n=1 Tax=Nocardiopsis sp. NPDC050513 TaxID=3364338 RepID=UPI003788E83F
MKKMLGRVLAVAAAGVFASTTFASPALASVKITAYETAPVRTQPYGSSHQVRTLQPGDYIYVDCFVFNSYGNRWYRTGAGFYTYAPHFPSYSNIYKC